MEKSGIITPTTLKVEYGSDAREFIRREGLAADVDAAFQRLQHLFPSAIRFDFSTAQDPEDTEPCLVVSIDAPLSADEFRALSDEFMASLRQRASKLYYVVAVLPG